MSVSWRPQSPNLRPDSNSARTTKNIYRYRSFSISFGTRIRKHVKNNIKAANSYRKLNLKQHLEKNHEDKEVTLKPLGETTSQKPFQKDKNFTPYDVSDPRD